jgi:hypothetical protein
MQNYRSKIKDNGNHMGFGEVKPMVGVVLQSPIGLLRKHAATRMDDVFLIFTMWFFILIFDI